VIPLAAGNCLERNDWICTTYLTTRKHEILSALHQHVSLVLVALFFGILIAVPLALVVRRWRRTESTVVGLTSFLYTIPSLALFGILVPYTGLTNRSVEIGLTLYTLVILVRNFVAALDAVPEDVREAARGMGFGSTRVFLRIDLPLALPAIVAGIRIAAVSTIALATVGAIIGHGGLGNLLYDAIGSNFKAEALTASVLCVLLAITADVLLLTVERLLTPWRKQRA
jgi:osmoprotectant transport system permease protein